ncbi:PASTA domain-containing protein [Microtetraspora niveoalba]|uniref:PASTA domain-containing protein n=1 Tax=Microtetraspora niveoalba TaxID=46175 RepID=UPI0008370016|nr:PASTA domain-containing protein [Microtetraspora niveoalba]
MNVEEALKEAMASRVAAVQAPPSMGQRVRRRNRRHVIRFRTAGAALLTVAVAGAVPVYLSATSGPAPSRAGVGAPVPGASQPVGEDSALAGNVVPDVVGLTNENVAGVLKAAGFKVGGKKILNDEHPPGTIIAQTPAAGTVAPEGARVEVTIATTAAPKTDQTPEPADVGLPQDLGDLGDGRTFGGIRLDYLPDGLEWGKWSGKDGFGKTSYATTWAEPSKAGTGEYSVEAVVYKGEAARTRRDRVDGTPVKIRGKDGYLGSFTEGGEVAGSSPETTLTLVWFPRADVTIELMFSPVFVQKLGQDAADAEIQKIAEGVTVKD